jgi:hypothetical protein
MIKFARIFGLLALLSTLALGARAQSLGYEGPTGVFVTPLAYTAASPAKGFGSPVVGYHFLAGGPVLGDFSTISVTEGFAKRFEFGYTSVEHAGGSYSDGKFIETKPYVYSVDLPSSLWNSNFSILHAKVNLLPENFDKKNWIPALSAGIIYRFNDQFGGNVANFVTYGDGPQDMRTNNEDIYVVASKIVPVTKPLSVLLSAGLRGTNASLWGLGGNAPGFQGKVFGAAALVLNGPAKSTIILGSEVSEQPQHIYLSPAVLENCDGFCVPASQTGWIKRSLFDVPTSEVYAVRIVPSPKHKFNFDVGVLHAGNNVSNPLTSDALACDVYGCGAEEGVRPRVTPEAGSSDVEISNVKINARARVAFGLSYAF